MNVTESKQGIHEIFWVRIPKNFPFGDPSNDRQENFEMHFSKISFEAGR
jgi:hypothetical protein